MPGVFEAVQFDGAHNRREKLPGIIVGKCKTITGTSIGIILLDCISQTPNTAYHWHTTIAHGDQLSQSTGFKTRRHQKHIAASIDRLSQLRVKGQENGHLLRITSRQRLKQLVILLIADSQHNHLYTLRKKWLSNLCDQVKTL